MSLTRKLGRLGLPRGGGAARSPVPGHSDDQLEREAGVEPICELKPEDALATTCDQRAHALDSLKAKMEAMLGHSPELVNEGEPRGSAVLPFVQHKTAEGFIHRRLERLPLSYRVGRVAVDAARTANPSVLALLSLQPRLSGVSMRRALYLDCETTGLGGAGTLPFLVGMAWFDGENLFLEQLLVKTPSEEPALIALVSERARSSGVLVTFNGKTFDWPLLKMRCVMNHAPQLPDLPHLDLLHVGRRLHRARIGSCRLTDLELNVLGFDRGPDIAGADVAARYGHFLRSGNEETLSAVVDHNAFDVTSMAALVALYGEPLVAFHEQDLLPLARTYRRARAWEAAELAADAAADRGVGAEALRLQAFISKARGDRAKALSRFEQLASQVDDAETRLELAKLYEHYVKQPAQALPIVGRGTGEDEAALSRRRSRLERKVERMTMASKSRRKKDGSESS